MTCMISNGHFRNKIYKKNIFGNIFDHVRAAKNIQQILQKVNENILKDIVHPYISAIRKAFSDFWMKY